MRSLALWLGLVCGCGRIYFDEIGVGDGGSLRLEPPLSTINLGSRQRLVASGGVPPYTFSITGGGYIDPLFGTRSADFVSPQRSGTTTVHVVDATAAQATASVIYEGSTLFVAGGVEAGVPTTAVRSSSDGVTWTLVGTLPQAVARGSLVVDDNRMLYIGGDTTGAPSDRIFASSDGVTWAEIGQLQGPHVSSQVTTFRDELYLVSGYTGSGNDQYVYVGVDGDTAFSIIGMFPTPRHEHGLISRNDRLVVIGGHGASLYTDVLDSPNGFDWTAYPGRLNFMMDFPAVAELGDRVLRVCGTGCTNTEYSDDLVTWAPGTYPGGARDGPALVGFRGAFILIGGGQSAVLSSPDGVSWNPIGTYPTAIHVSAVQFTPP